MLRQLSFVNGESTVVGSYFVVQMGQYFKQVILDSLVGQLDRIRHGGIILVHGMLRHCCELAKELTVS